MGIDPALVQSLKNIDPEHFSVCHSSAVSSFTVLKHVRDDDFSVAILKRKRMLV